jgi:hypothetical protein
MSWRDQGTGTAIAHKNHKGKKTFGVYVSVYNGRFNKGRFNTPIIIAAKKIIVAASIFEAGLIEAPAASREKPDQGKENPKGFERAKWVNKKAGHGGFQKRLGELRV